MRIFVAVETGMMSLYRGTKIKHRFYSHFADVIVLTLDFCFACMGPLGGFLVQRHSKICHN